MLRNESLEELTDGERYTSDSVVKVDPDGCRGCHLCCEVVEDTIILDPYDLHALKKGLGKTFEELMRREIALGVYDGIILPHLMLEEDREISAEEALSAPISGTGKHCVFLGQEGEMRGRCLIHAFRPGFCRLFPMGRLYEEDGFSYVLLKNECPYADKKACTVRDWLGIEDLEEYEAYVTEWHDLIVRIREELPKENEEDRQKISLFLLQSFYITPYGERFYEDFRERLEKVKGVLFA